MAWIRTAISLISFGFTLYKFFQLDLNGRGPENRIFDVRPFATVMIVIGLLALLMATMQHRQDLRILQAEYPTVFPRSLARLLAILISFLGVLALALVALRR